VLLEKYAKGGEHPPPRCARASPRALAAAEPEGCVAHWEARFLEARSAASSRRPHQLGAGTSLTATLDQLLRAARGRLITEVVGRQARIYTALAEAAETMRRGGGVGYDFSSIRPEALGEGHQLARERARCRTCVSSTNRARRGIGRRAPRRADGRAALRPSGHRALHPREGSGELTNFNISVGVTDAFMRAVEADGEIELVAQAEPART
jgi:ribonucleoside-diphosphate reductase alpha chain